MQIETRLDLVCKFMGLYYEYQRNKHTLDSDAIQQLDILFETAFSQLIPK
jgi:hypothetical protein